MNLKFFFTFYLVSFFTIIFLPGCSKNPNAGLSPANPANNKMTGASSNDLLSSGKFSSLNIEIQYMAGFHPDSASINQLIFFLNSLIYKTGGITVTQAEIPARGNHCKVQSCLMYYAAETADLPGYFITRDIPTLDPQCLADLRANGGK